jgi:hypothetical protein
VRRHAQQGLALGQRLGDQAKLVVLEIAQPAVNQLGRGRRGGRREIATLDQQHRKTAPGRLARDAGAIDAAADNEEIVVRTRHGGAL